MNIWQKICTGTKFLFGGFDAATDYLLNTVLNPYLSVDAVASKISKAYDCENTVLGYLRKYECFCPPKWLNDYQLVIGAVDALVSVFADGKVERQEIALVIDAFENARTNWNAD